MRAGNLRDPIAIRRPSEVQSATGDYVETWELVAAPFAMIEGMSGRESMIARALTGVATYRVTIRWRSGITTDDQITLADGTTLNITSVSDPDGRRRLLVILAETGTTQREA